MGGRSRVHRGSVQHEEQEVLPRSRGYAILPRDNTDATGTPIGASIGQTILFPYIFFKHDRTIKSLPASDPQTYFRTHWHSGLNTPYGLKTIMNFWSSQCDWVSTSSTFAAPNGAAVTKSIYDPCPVGYHVPSPNSFAALSKRAGIANMDENAYGLEDIFDDETGIRIGWKLSLNETDGGTKIFFPATGLRDMGRTDTTTADKVDIPEEFEGTTWPAHADLTFVATTGFCPITGSFQSMLFFWTDVRIKIGSCSMALRTTPTASPCDRCAISGRSAAKAPVPISPTCPCGKSGFFVGAGGACGYAAILPPNRLTVNRKNFEGEKYRCRALFRVWLLLLQRLQRPLVFSPAFVYSVRTR